MTALLNFRPAMCLILLAHQAHPDARLILAANRDERYARPCTPPGLFCANPPIVAGQDLAAGGTWLGLNGQGMWAAVTNRYDQAAPMENPPRSRGSLVAGVLAQPGVALALEWLQAEPLDGYNPFNLIFGDGQALWWLSNATPPPWRPQPLPPGFYGVANGAPDDERWHKIAQAKQFWAAHRQLAGEALLDALKLFLLDDTPAPLPKGAAPPPNGQERPVGLPFTPPGGAVGAVFIRTPLFGTRSSAIITLGGRLGGRYLYAAEEPLRKAMKESKGAVPNGLYQPVDLTPLGPGWARG